MIQKNIKALLNACKIGEPDAVENLSKMGVRNSVDLVKWTATPSSLSSLARASGLTEQSLRRLADWADLSRLPGLTSKEIALLMASGVASLQNLARNDPPKFLSWIREVNEEARLVRAVPPLDRIAEWITTAKTLAPHGESERSEGKKGRQTQALPKNQATSEGRKTINPM